VMFGRWVRVAVAWLLPWLPDKGSKAPRANSIAHTADKVSSATRRTTWDGAVDAAAVAAVAVLTAVFAMSAFISRLNLCSLAHKTVLSCPTRRASGLLCSEGGCAWRWPGCSHGFQTRGVKPPGRIQLRTRPTRCRAQHGEQRGMAPSTRPQWPQSQC